MAFEGKTTEDVAKDYVEGLCEYEDYLVVAEEVHKKIEGVRSRLKILETELVKRNVEIKDVGT